MIKVNKGMVEINGTEAVVVAETMCYMKSFVERVLIPKWGSKEAAQKEMSRIMEEVFNKVDGNEGENEVPVQGTGIRGGFVAAVHD